ncbi:hypothetical protein EST38_g801 [Candolleomyces aberdarensis]|uniref:Adhesin domain-containing protein n=1 Tax=Candolleomyces aberdarensis TaxID=2316362 RepID=A0A4Q2DWJ1_9AGAR|nr:hypothetical protein EST38_g801 [Candolleomyces aberdarensis]
MSSSRGFSFWGTVAGVWTALRVKKEWDDYRAVSSDDPEARVRLPDSSLPRGDAEAGGVDEDDAALLDTNIRVRRQKKKATGCCVCCGIDCTLFWKAFAFVLAIWTVYGIFKFARWAVTPSPTGLEGMPVFGKDLGCDHAATYYKDAPDGDMFTSRPPQARTKSNSRDLVIMKGTDKVLMDLVNLKVDESKFGSRLEVNTPSISKADVASGAMCIRYDVVLAVPKNVKELYVRGTTTLQVKFDEKAHLDVERLSVILFTSDEKNLILPQPGFHASDELYLEVYRGWVVGEVSVGDNTIISTQRSDAVANVKIHPTQSHDLAKAGKVAKFNTASGSGRSEYFYITNKASKRPIESRHISAKNGDVYLRYAESGFNGKIALTSKSSTIWGAVTKVEDTGAPTQWNYIRGSADGGDKMVVESGGWTGLYF